MMKMRIASRAGTVIVEIVRVTIVRVMVMSRRTKKGG
jgi:hypothetical protein